MDRAEGITQTRADFNCPKYRQIHNYLLQQFREGVYSPSEPLPGERSLAVSMNVAVGTLRQALQQLESDGFIHRVPGKGTFINSPQEQREQIKTNVFSVIVPSFSEYPYPLLVEGLNLAVAVDDRYRITVGSTMHDVSHQERLILQAVKDNVAGVAIVPTADPTPAEHIRMLQEKHIPVVFCHRAVAGVAAPLVSWSFEKVGRIAAETLLQRGHRRITYLASMRYEAGMRISAGVRGVFQEQGIDKSGYRVHYHGVMSREISDADSDMFHAAIRESLEQILNDKNRSTAIICGALESDLIYLIANELGFRIPKDLSLIYSGSNRPHSILVKSFTRVTRDERELGVQAGRLLCEMSSGLRPLENQERIEIPLEFFPGETVAPPPS